MPIGFLNLQQIHRNFRDLHYIDLMLNGDDEAVEEQVLEARARDCSSHIGTRVGKEPPSAMDDTTAG